MVLGVTTM